VLLLLSGHTAQENSHRGFLLVLDGIRYCHWIALGIRTTRYRTVITCKSPAWPEF
jgi:hypothetical protein